MELHHERFVQAVNSLGGPKEAKAVAILALVMSDIPGIEKSTWKSVR